MVAPQSGASTVEKGSWTKVSKLQDEISQSVHALDKSGFIPLYYQIQQMLMDKIRSGQLIEGDPTSAQLPLAHNGLPTTDN